MAFITIVDLIEMIERENWREDAQSFLAVRMSILTALLSSPQELKQPDAAFSPSDDIFLDLADPMLSNTGLDNILMDMYLHQFICDSSRGRSMLGRVIF
jgi:hypothetical protein